MRETTCSYKTLVYEKLEEVAIKLLSISYLNSS